MDAIDSSPPSGSPRRPGLPPLPTSSGSTSPGGGGPSSPDMTSLRAAAAARRQRRAAAATNVKKASGALSKPEDAEVESLKAELAAARVEMSSLRRNHVENLKSVSAERDMFAEALAKEQTRDGKAAANKDAEKARAELASQLKAARLRNQDLEAENKILRDEVKQLGLKLQAGRTLQAETTGYEQVVVDLIEVKLKCANLAEECESLALTKKRLTTVNEGLQEQNRKLEDSRSEWVIKCAELERKLQTSGSLSGSPVAVREEPNIKTLKQIDRSPEKTPVTRTVVLERGPSLSPTGSGELHELSL